MVYCFILSNYLIGVITKPTLKNANFLWLYCPFKVSKCRYVFACKCQNFTLKKLNFRKFFFKLSLMKNCPLKITGKKYKLEKLFLFNSFSSHFVTKNFTISIKLLNFATHQDLFQEEKNVSQHKMFRTF